MLSTIEQVSILPKQLNQGSQHTFIYSCKTILLYLPLNHLYLILIVSKQANILEMQRLLQNIQKKLQDMAICEANL